MCPFLRSFLTWNINWENKNTYKLFYIHKLIQKDELFHLILDERKHLHIYTFSDLKFEKKGILQLSTILNVTKTYVLTEMVKNSRILCISICWFGMLWPILYQNSLSFSKEWPISRKCITFGTQSSKIWNQWVKTHEASYFYLSSSKQSSQVLIIDCSL